MDPKIKELMDKRAEMRKELSKYDAAIHALQTLCPHEKEWDLGHSHNDNLYECQNCGRKVWK